MAEKEIDSVKIRCPLCKDTHEYNIEKQSSPIMYKITEHMEESEQKRKFRVVVACPEKDENYRATIEVTQSFGEVIDNIGLSLFKSD